MAGFNLAEMLSSAGVNLDTERKLEIEHISIDLIVPDPNNFYALSDLDELAASIATVGLQQPLLVRPMDGDENQVIITSGHRRHAALKMLIEQDGREDLRDVPCIVCPPDENPKLTQLRLIMANSTARKLSSADLARQAEQITQLLRELKEDGMEFPGRMRDHVARACGVSTGKLGRIQQIQNGLIPELREKWERGEINDEKAYNLSHASHNMQVAECRAMEQPKPASPIQPAAGKDSPCQKDVDAANQREQERLEDQISRAYVFLENMKDSAILHQFLQRNRCRNDIIKHIKAECSHRANFWHSNFQYSFERNYVRVGDGLRPMTEYTYTEFVDAILIAAASKYLHSQPTAQATSSAAQIWQTGEPKEPGYYLCKFKLPPDSEPMYSEFWWGGKKWTKLTGMEEILCWVPAPEDE